ncbi:MAG: BrnT family toxin [Halobacteriovoraceae bacterium]|nr:BrnT family toxin [Halobacteriovoraceae bacterium]
MAEKSSDLDFAKNFLLDLMEEGLSLQEALAETIREHGVKEFCTLVDDEHSINEDRFLIIGKSSTGNTLIVIHCFRKNDKIIRIISARKATKKEKNIYEERI